MDIVVYNSTFQQQLDIYEEDAEPFQLVMFINGIIAILANAFLAYLILRKTPREMNEYRWYLMNIGVSSGFCGFGNLWYFFECKNWDGKYEKMCWT
jgi:hypothetical protein